VTPTEAQGAQALYAPGEHPKLRLKGMAPSMSSTPIHRGTGQHTTLHKSLFILV